MQTIELKLGVIGVGGRGGLTALAHKPGNGSRIVAGADVNPEAIEKFKETYGKEVFVTDDYRQLLERKEVDAVFIITPDYLHEEHAVAALEAGKTVFLEKPMAITIEGCDRILATAMRTGTKLYMGHNMRYFPSVVKMKEIIDSGVIGSVQAVWCRHFVSYGGDAYFKTWHSERRFGNGLLLQKGAHDIDVIHWLAGGYTVSVAGMGKLSVYDKCPRREPTAKAKPLTWTTWPPEKQAELSPVIDVEDHNMIMMQLDNGVQASYMQCHYTPDAGRNYTFIGTKGRIENIGDCGQCEIHVWTQRDLDAHRAVPDIIYKLKPQEGTHGGADPKVIDAFLEFARFGTKPNTSPVAARQAVATGVCGHESMRGDGGRTKVPPLPDDIVAYFENGQQ